VCSIVQNDVPGSSIDKDMTVNVQDKWELGNI